MTKQTERVIINLRKRKRQKGGVVLFDEKKFRAALALRGMTMKELCEKIGMSAPTLYRKLRRDGDFSRSEMNKIIIALNIEDPESIFFAN